VPGVRSGLEIQQALKLFVKKWSGYAGSERAEAQSFLNDLFAAYGTDRSEAGAKFESFTASAGFMDLFLPGVLIVEMKAPHVPLEKAKDQRVRYWQESSDSLNDVPAARYVVACNFGEFEIWEPGRFPNDARTRFPLSELPDRYDALLFLQSQTLEPVFSEHRRTLTTDAATHIAALYTSLADRSAAPIDEIQRFVMQLVWCLFAEDLGMLDGYPLQNTVDVLLKEQHPDSARDIGYLFTLLNQKGNHNRQGRYEGTRYVNGELFQKPAAVFMNRAELEHLRDAAVFNWRAVDPTIFGSLMEGVLGQERRDMLGAHYTHEADIMKIVSPTVIRPWRERIAATSTPQQARDLLDDLCAFRVLDPSCGCGNFLYVAYRELRGLEHETKNRITALAHSTGLPAPTGPLPYFPLRNMYGIDIERIAVLIARVTLWMGHRQMVDRYGDAEPVLPLVDLSGVRTADALRTEWPQVDTIIGNPPFLGSQLLRSKLGGPYVEWLGSHFKVGIRDLCTYWFRRAQEQLLPGQRAGLVGTNSISQNAGRAASLDYVIATGGVITDAVSSQKWPGEAKVHVSIVNWVKSPSTIPQEFDLDGEHVTGITSSLREGAKEDWAPKRLPANKEKCFQGPIPVGAGFIISGELAASMLADTSADYAKVIRPYLTSSDIADRPDQQPSRWIIDFAQMPLETAMKYKRALDVVRNEVRPFRATVRREGHKRNWWMFGEPRVSMRRELLPLARFAAVGAHGKRMLIAWQEKVTLPSNANMVFAFDDDYSIGILTSRAHEAWAWEQSSTIKGDLRYTPTSAFDTFVWPEPSDATARANVAAASKALYARRSEICAAGQIGLTKLYNAMDDGAYADLRNLHWRLDEAVVAAYGWPRSIAQDSDELVRRLRARNREVSEGLRTYSPFG
jgi:hypothetical protein